MLAVDVQQSTIEKALVFYQSHLESVREQQENDLPRNGKARATAEDLAVERVFDEQLQAIAGLLDSTSKGPEQAAQEVKIPPKDTLPHRQILKEKIFDEFDTEPYINPFTGQLITPETPFSAGPSIAHISVNPSYLERHEPIILGDSPRRQTAAVLQQPLPQDPKWENRPRQPPAKPDVGQSRPPSYKSVESVRSFDTRSTVPLARSYVSQAEVPEALPISKSRWGKISRLKRMSSKASFEARNEKRADGLQGDALIDIAPEINHAAVGKGVPIESPASPTITADRQSGHQHLQTTSPYAIVHGEQKRPFMDRPSPWRHKFPRQSSTKATENQSLAWATAPPEVSVSKSDIASVANPYSARIRTSQPEIVARKPPEIIHESLLRDTGVRKPSAPARYAPTSPLQSSPAALSSYEAVQARQGNHINLERLTQVGSELARSPPIFEASLGWTEHPADEPFGSSSNLAEPTAYEKSLKLAIELSGGFPQDYASLKQIQEEHEISAQLLESQRLAQELAGGSPQDYAALARLETENENTLEKFRSADIEWQRSFEADRKLAQSLAAGDVPQQIEEFHRVDGERQLRLQEDARIAKEIAEREDRAEMEAQMAMARQLQAEWNASETNRIAEEQRLARELSEQEDRLELERQNAEFQQFQAEWDHQEPTPWTDHPIGVSDTTFSGDTWTSEQPPAYTTQNLPSQVLPETNGRGLDTSDHLHSYTSPPTPQRKRNKSKATTRPQSPQPQASTRPLHSRDEEELSRIIAERRARHGQWQADVQKAKQAAKEVEEDIRRRAKEEEKEIRRLEQQRAQAEKARKAEEARQLEEQRALAEKARKAEEARQAAIEAERRARQADCTVCGDAADKSEMAILPCNHAYDAGCISRKLQSTPFNMMTFSLLTTDFQRRSTSP
jgi:hypothetical protein